MTERRHRGHATRSELLYDIISLRHEAVALQVAGVDALPRQVWPLRLSSRQTRFPSSGGERAAPQARSIKVRLGRRRFES